VLDAHHHLWDLAVREQPWLLAEERAAIRRDFSRDDLAAAVAGGPVTGTVLVQVRNDADETRDLLASAAGDPLVRAVVGWADLTDPAIGDRLAALRASVGGDRLAGIRHQVLAEPDPAGWLSRPEVARGLRAVAAAGLAYELIVRPAHFAAVARLLRAHPDLVFVLDHLGKPPIATGPHETWARGIRDLAAAPNLYCKLSGLVTMARPDEWTAADLLPYAWTAVEAFGPQRTMFGSDWPVCLLAAPYARVVSVAEELTAALGAAERELIFAGTARRVFGPL
jgi:L-fuconolactonase